MVTRLAHERSGRSSLIGRSGTDPYDVLAVENYEDGAGTEKASWTRVGVAFAHKDGNGLNVELRAIPVSGKLVIRRRVETEIHRKLSAREGRDQ